MKLYKEQIGKRTSKKINKPNPFAAILETAVGKIQYFFDWWNSALYEEEDEEIEFVDTTAKPTIYEVTIQSYDDIEHITKLVSLGCTVLVHYSTVSEKYMEILKKELSKSLMLIGTHYDDITNGLLVCGPRGVVVDKKPKEGEAQLLYLNKAPEKNRVPVQEVRTIPAVDPNKAGSIYTVMVQNANDAPFIAELIQAGYTVVANYRNSHEEKPFFIRDLKDYLSEINATFYPIANGIIACGYRGSISVYKSQEEQPKVYHIDFNKKR